MSVALRLAFASLLLASPVAAQQVQITPLLLYGIPLPLPGAPALESVVQYRENAAGWFAFESVVDPNVPTICVFAGVPGGALEKVACSGDEGPGGVSFYEARLVGIESSGAIVVYGNGCTQVEPWSCFFGFFRASEMGFAPLLLAGDAAPGTGGGTFSQFESSYFALASDGRLAFVAQIEGGSTSSGLFLASPGGVAPIALAGAAAPGGGSFGAISHPDVNDAGQVAFVADTGIAGNGPDGAFLHDGTGLLAVARIGELAPGGVAFSGFGSARVDDAGLVSFDASASTQRGIFTESGGGLRAVALSGQNAPGMSVPFETVKDPEVGPGTIAFRTYGQTEASPAGVFAEVDGTLLSVAKTHDPAPGGGEFVVSDIADLTPQGDIAIFAWIVDDGATTATGVFRARLAPQVPALGAPALALAALLLGASGAVLARCRARA